MSDIYYKTVKGRRYKYRCLRSWRDADGKVHKQEEYLGPVAPVDRTPVMQRLPKAVQNQIHDNYQNHRITVQFIQDIVLEHTGTKPSVSTIYNFLKTQR